MAWKAVFALTVIASLSLCSIVVFLGPDIFLAAAPSRPKQILARASSEAQASLGSLGVDPAPGEVQLAEAGGEGRGEAHVLGNDSGSSSVDSGGSFSSTSSGIAISSNASNASDASGGGSNISSSSSSSRGSPNIDRSNSSTNNATSSNDGGGRVDASPENGSCSTVFLSTFFTSKKDPQMGAIVKQTRQYFDAFRNSILSTPGASAVILHDGLNAKLIKDAIDPASRFSFEKINASRYDPKLGLNDLRFFAYFEKIESHPEWDTVFMTDISDVVVLNNPCALVDKAPGKLFVGDEPFKMKDSWYMDLRFKDMGGRYFQWFQNSFNATPDLPIFNAGIVGGRRGKVLEFLEHMTSAISDPDLKSRKEKKEVKVNMAALNWVLHNKFNSTDIYPKGELNTVFKSFEVNRTDVYFRHKL